MFSFIPDFTQPQVTLDYMPKKLRAENDEKLLSVWPSGR